VIVKQTIIQTDNIQSFIFLNEFFGAPQIGHFQSSGNFSKGVSAAMLFSGSPYSESYMKPQMVHFHFAIVNPSIICFAILPPKSKHSLI